ncbi:MAG: hypothetical protein LIP23_01340, partial [Planctomycetes bacterium]|nr:hypothetical protein [Planctomycetota bacterium]
PCRSSAGRVSGGGCSDRICSPSAGNAGGSSTDSQPGPGAAGSACPGATGGYASTSADADRASYFGTGSS